MGTYNTPWSVKYGFPSVDMRPGEVMKTAVEMLTGERTERKVILKPQIVEHPASEDENCQWPETDLIGW